MSENLSDALNLAKKIRNVQSKHIIWESGVSKSQFYRIIKGEEAPSPKTKARITESLGIDSGQFDLLHSRSKQIPDDTAALDSKIRSGFILILLISILLLGVAALTVYLSQGLMNANTKASVALEEDRTLFIKDVTIPDGTLIPVNTQYVKTWRVKNVGTVAWKDRYLRRMTPSSDLICSSPKMVPIPETLPGETVDISVTFVTPHLPGSCRTDWKTADDRGNLYFPDMHGLYSIVVVTK